MEDDFIGTTFPTPDGGVLTVVGWNGERQGCGSKKYTVECSICSKDKGCFGFWGSLLQKTAGKVTYVYNL